MENELVGNWIGDLRGTDIGNVFTTIARENGTHRVDVKVNVSGEVTQLIGSIDKDASGKPTGFTLNGTTQAVGVPALTAKVNFDSVSNDRLAGTWALSNGHAGVVVLHRYSMAQAPSNSSSSSSPSQPPAQLIAREGQLSNVLLYRGELETVVTKMKAEREGFELSVQVQFSPVEKIQVGKPSVADQGSRLSQALSTWNPR